MEKAGTRRKPNIINRRSRLRTLSDPIIIQRRTLDVPKDGEHRFFTDEQNEIF